MRQHFNNNNNNNNNNQLYFTRVTRDSTSTEKLVALKLKLSEQKLTNQKYISLKKNNY